MVGAGEGRGEGEAASHEKTRGGLLFELVKTTWVKHRKKRGRREGKKKERV